MGKSVLITGCSSGIGRALAFEFQLHFFQVRAPARNTESLTELEHVEMRTLALDITKSESINNAVKQLKNESAKLDVLVNNASQENPTPTGAFAHALVNRLIQPRPNSVIRLGKSSTLIPALKRWLPEGLLDKILSKKFQLNKL